MVQSSGIGSGSTEIDNPGKRAAVLLFVVGIAMTALAMRLVWLQVLQNNFYKARALENSTRVTFLRARAE